jgi:hypothetical protein
LSVVAGTFAIDGLTNERGGLVKYRGRPVSASSGAMPVNR